VARRNQIYAIRLAVEGGGQVKAELVSVGQSGEQSLKRIVSAGERASGGLKGLGRQAELLRTGIRTRKGRAYGFRFKDWTDYKATGQLLGTGDGTQTQFQLVKSYPSGNVIEVRSVTKPVAGTVRIYKDGIEQLSGWSVNVTKGLITFTTAPAGAVEITADFAFDVPVRFDTDHMAVTIETFRLHRWQQIPIVELRS
jgi:uncharacterized protein (TIGR02217 family)